LNQSCSHKRCFSLQTLKQKQKLFTLKNQNKVFNFGSLVVCAKLYSTSTRSYSFIEAFDYSGDTSKKSISFTDPSQKEGLFSLPVYSPSDWEIVANEHIRQCKNVIDSLDNFENLSPSEVCFIHSVFDYDYNYKNNVIGVAFVFWFSYTDCEKIGQNIRTTLSCS
jgi:hypothetical protein